MNDQYFGERLYTPNAVEETNKYTNDPAVNSDSFADKVPVDAAEIHETPMGGTVASVGPLTEPVAAEVPLFETPDQEIPMGGTVAAVGPMDEAISYNAPVDENIPYKAPVVETIPDNAPVDENIPYMAPVVETIPDKALADENIPYMAPVVETIPDKALADENIPYMAPVVETIPEKALADENIPYKAPVVESIPYKAPVDETITHEAPIVTVAAPSVALLSREESEHFRSRWNEIQGKFVDEPRLAVQQADALVTEVIGQITQIFAAEHSSLESQWDKGNDASTEDLRNALRRYRSFFNRLVV